MQPSDNSCPKCGHALPADAPWGMCSRCLLAGVLEDGPMDPMSRPVERMVLPRLFAGYELLEEVARGGMGVVYRARQRPIDRMVALKVLAAGEFAAPDFVERFRREAAAAASLTHPNIVPIHEVGESEGLPFYSMRLVEGRTLAARIAASGPGMPEVEAAELTLRLARAVHFAHQRGILHRDIKPANVLMEAGGEPQLTDFGLAKLLEANSDLTRTMAVLGTPSFMAPEQARGDGRLLTTAVDVYGLGALLYAVLTGQPPFAGGSTMETVRQVLEKDPRRPSTLRPGLDRDLEIICLKALEKDPARRYGSAEAMAEDLARWLRHETIAARPASLRVSLAKWIRRHPGRAVAAGFVAVLGPAILLGSLWFGLRVKAERDRADENARSARAGEESLRGALARAQTAVAEAAYRAHDGPAMVAALESVPEDLRDSTWHYLSARGDASLATLDTPCVGAAWHPLMPGVFAVTRRTGDAALVDAGTGRLLREVKLTDRQRAAQHSRAVAISPDGRRLAVGALGKGGLAIYDLTDGRVLGEWAGPELDTLEFSADGGQLLGASTIQVEIGMWDAASGARAWQVKGATRAAFQPGLDTVVALSGTEVLLLRAADGSVVRTAARLRNVALGWDVSPDGQLLAAGDTDGFVTCMSLTDGGRLHETRIADRFIRALEFTGDGRRLATVCAGDSEHPSIQILDAVTGTRMQSVLGGSSAPETLRVHPLSDELIVTGSRTKTWKLRGGRPRWTLPPAATAAFSGEQNALLLPSGSGVAEYLLHGTEAQPTAWKLDGDDQWNVAASPDGRTAVATRWNNLESESRVLRRGGDGFEPGPTIRAGYAVSFERLSPSGDRLLLFVPGGGLTGHYDTATGAKLPGLEGSERIVTMHDAVWLDDATVAGARTVGELRGAEGSQDQIVAWEAATGRTLRAVNVARHANLLASAPDGERLADAGDDKFIRIRRAETFEVELEFRAHDSSITALAWHPTRPVIASSSTDLTLRLWDADTGMMLEEMRGHVRHVHALVFSPDGTRLVSAGDDVTNVWEPAALRHAVPP